PRVGLGAFDAVGDGGFVLGDFGADFGSVEPVGERAGVFGFAVHGDVGPEPAVGDDHFLHIGVGVGVDEHFVPGRGALGGDAVVDELFEIGLAGARERGAAGEGA